ncbi:MULTISPECIES: DUF4331 domain-containing protein [Corallococcus]|uniref:DUF4331 domain-containing protein n=1 Tax=Corallococcus TaxID=83461 RepID=UPI00117DC4BE|nr:MULTISPECIES: DUF4331 domain-containing protein [Corallococcus]NBD11291.1 DUF4331 domain-containing protein [Corallococcus silvisoli]TSC26524.1 DUF4331 domain-containing protein [Corallococcus sp. Z5C101001]
MRAKKLAAVLTIATTLGATGAIASSHREAPFITQSPKVDGTDLYLFRSYEAGRADFVTMIADYMPFQERYGGPNFFTMDPEALYEIHIDNTGDAQEDLTFQFRFTNTLANSDKGAALTIGTGADAKSVPVPLFNVGPITTANQANLNVKESFTLKVIRGNRRTGTAKNVTNAAGGSTTFLKPTDYIGTKSLGDLAAYEAYVKEHIYTVNIPDCPTPGKVFVGQRKEPFAVNLGPIFDLVNAPAAIITDPAKRDAVPNPLAHNNITTLALEVPIACLKGTSQDIIGAWTTASVRQARAINPTPTFANPAREGGAWQQVSRLGMPLVNELIIGLPDKDKFNTSQPKDDAQFATYVTNPTLPALLETLFGTKAPTVFPRADLVAAFLTGVTGVNANGSTAEMQRLNMALPATPKANQNNLGAAGCFLNGKLDTTLAGCDPAGFPNGRRPGDDVVDIELRVAMGYLLANDTQAPSRNVAFTDAVLQDASQFDAVFPYLTTPNAGANGNGT